MAFSRCCHHRGLWNACGAWRALLWQTGGATAGLLCWAMRRFSMCPVPGCPSSGRASQSDAVTAGHQSIWVTWLSCWTLDKLWNLVDVGLDYTWVISIWCRPSLWDMVFTSAFHWNSSQENAHSTRGKSPRIGDGFESCRARGSQNNDLFSKGHWAAPERLDMLGQGPVMGWASNRQWWYTEHTWGVLVSLSPLYQSFEDVVVAHLFWHFHVSSLEGIGPLRLLDAETLMFFSRGWGWERC